MDSVTIDRQDDGTHGAYAGTVAGIDGEARLEYRHESANVIAAVHTETPEALRGKGIALKLVERLVEDARSEGTRIHALCSYVDHERKKHPEWADVFVTP
jgi:predicted GNAT family acetyltransferase